MARKAAQAVSKRVGSPDGKPDRGGRGATTSDGRAIARSASPGRARRRPAAGTVTKADGVRAALAQGVEAPGAIVDFLRDRYGIAITKPMASSYKAKLGSRDPKQAKGKPGRKPRAAIERYLAPPPQPRGGGEGGLLETLEALKPLIAEHGADKLHRLVDLLG
jgi:hypothetical protein